MEKPTTLSEYVLAMLERHPDLSMRSASIQAGLNPNSIHQIVNEQRPHPRHDTLKAIADTLGTEHDYYEMCRLAGYPTPVPPGVDEEEIKLLPCVEHTMVYGLNRPYTVCLVFPDFVVMEKLAAKNGWAGQPAAMVADPAVQAYIQGQILDHLKGRFGSYEIPKKFIVLREGFTVDNGMLTQTFKLKRREVLKAYQPLIEKAYTQE